MTTPTLKPTAGPEGAVGCRDLRSLVPSALPIIGAGGAPAASLVLRTHPGSGSRDVFQVLVVDAQGCGLIGLGPYAEEEVVATWRALSAASGLPIAIESTAGERQSPWPQIGRVQLGAVRIRRRHGHLGGRRPRFLARRKTGRLPLRPQIFREPEIAAGKEV